MDNIKNIKNYILFLKRECGLYITLHPHGNEWLITLSELMTFNIHDNPYCVYIKTFDHAWKHCVERQKKVLNKCREGAFCGQCFAGVTEFVYPIKHGNEILGFISVSGYKTENAESYIKKVAQDYLIPMENLKKTYTCLKGEIPEREWVDTLILPLCDMLELAYTKNGEDSCIATNATGNILSYVKRHHTRNITLEDICERFGVSRSYISHSFKKISGKSFREFLTEIRLRDAKSLLEYSELSVTEIALSVGFSDSAYFSKVFQKEVGLSPTVYRKNRKAKQRS